MRITFIQPASPNPAKNALIWPPIGLCRLASSVTAAGHTVKILEDALHRYSRAAIVAAVADQDIVGLGAMTIQADRAEEITAWIREDLPNVLVVLGGPHYTATATPRTDGVVTVRGYGEEGLLRVIAGERGIVTSGKNPDYLDVSYDFITYSKYGDHLIDGRRAISILTSLGCPFQCRFCGSPSLFGRKITEYDVSRVVNNIRALSAKHDIQCIRVMDDTFTLRASRLQQFRDQLRGSNLTLSCLTHISCLDNNRQLLLKEMGVLFVAVGVESADPDVLALAKKNVDFQKLERQLQVGIDLGLKYECLFMLGLPGDTVVGMRRSIEYARKLKKLGVSRVHFQYYTPFPGASFSTAIDQGMYGTMLSRKWSEYNHRSPVFLPTGVSLAELTTIGAEAFSLDNR